MSIQFSQGKLKGEERQSIIQEIQRQAKAAALAAVKPVFTTFMEAKVTAKLGRGKREARHVSGQAREIDWQCASCGSRDSNQFMRDGHYRLDLETGWGHLKDVQVPMLECQNCGHDVICHFAIMEKFRRFWVDFEQDVVGRLPLALPSTLVSQPLAKDTISHVFPDCVFAFHRLI